VRNARVGRRLAVWIAALMLGGLSGCGTQGPKVVPVEGTVTFAGGPCPASGTVFFAPVTVPSDLPRRPARGQFDSNGRLTVTSFRADDGLVPGTYRVSVDCWQEPPTDISSGKSFVPADYHSADVTIPRDARGTVRLKIDVPAKRGR
jgi:hypothetical protein